MFHDLPTPFIAISGPVVRRNLKNLAIYAAKHNVSVRPHTKTHKSLFVAKLQLEHGARGLTVAKVGEAKVMSQACRDLFMAYPAPDAARAMELAKLAKENTIRVGLDSAYAADLLQSAAKNGGVKIGVLVDFDAGNHRTGVQSPAQALALARHVARQSNLTFDGLMFYPGHLKRPPEETRAGLMELANKLQEILDTLNRDGLEVKIVSGGSTPTALGTHLLPGITEIRPGTYVYNDVNSLREGCATMDDVAARIVTTVISTAVPGQIVLDAGSKTLTNDLCGLAPSSGHGIVVEYPNAKITKLSEEHAQVDVSQCDRVPKIGDRVSIIPNHICPCINLQDSFWWFEEGFDQSAAPTKMPVDARGKVV